jgi:proline iminopeptidase
VSPHLDKVKAKTLCLSCDQDPICSEKSARATAEGIEGAELRVIRDCGHFPWIEKPDEFLEEVLRFMML